MVNELYEYTVTKRPKGTYMLARIGMITLYVAFVIAFFGACYASGFVPVFAVAPVFTWMLIFFTWRYVSIEYKYTVERGMLTLYIVYGGKKTKQLAELHIKEAIAFLPLAPEDDPKAAFSPTLTYDLRSSPTDAKDAYAFLVETNGERILALLEVPAPSRKAILYYASETVKKGSAHA